MVEKLEELKSKRVRLQADINGLQKSADRLVDKAETTGNYQHGFRPGHSTTSALLQLTNDVATDFNQRKPPHRTICVAVDLTAAFDTVNHNILLSNSAR